MIIRVLDGVDSPKEIKSYVHRFNPKDSKSKGVRTISADKPL